MKIYVKIKEGVKINNIKELIEYLYSKDGSDHHYSQKTYRDEGCTNTQCKGYRRSFEDLYDLSKTYFPNATKPELMSALMSIPRLRWYRCNDIGKIVFHGAGSRQVSKEHFQIGINIGLNGRLTKETHKLNELIEIIDQIEKEKI